MIRTTVVGSWPVANEFADRIQGYHAGRLTAQEAESLLTEVAARAMYQQRHCGLDEYTGGETWTDNFILHFPKLISGIVPTSNKEAWDGRGTFEVVGPLTAPNGLGVAAAYRRESGIDRAISKVNIPGPSEITMMIGPKKDRAALLQEAIELIRAEMQACIQAGAKEVQIDLPHIAMGLVDDEMVTAEAVGIIRSLYAGITGVRRSIHFCYGDCGAQTWTRNRSFHPLLPAIEQLDGAIDRVVLEMSLPEQWQERQLLSEIPASIEAALGIVDVKSGVVESVDDLVTKITELMSIIPPERLLICPSCGLGRRNVDMAIGKATAMVAAVRAAKG